MRWVDQGRAAGAAAGAWLVLLLAFVAGGCAARGPGIERYPQFAEFDGERISVVRFVDPAPYTADTLQTLIRTEPTRCQLLGLPLCVPLTRIGRQVQRLDVNVLAADVDRLASFYRRRGFFGTRVIPDVERLEEDRLRVTFEILRSDPIRLESLTLSGTEGIVDPDSLAPRLPLQPGDPFDLDQFGRTADYVMNVLRDRGHAFAELLRSYAVDTAANSAVAELEALPGPQVLVDSILISGMVHLRRGDVLRQLAFEPGDVLNFRQLVESHRNLYNLELVQLATVRLAPDTLQVAPADSTRATVEVSVAEAPLRQIDAALGYGRVECLRTELQWLNRSFLGGGRRLQIQGSLSRIGIADPLNFVGGTVCPERSGDEFGDLLDYSLGVLLTQPYFVNPRNHLTLELYTERISEPQVFQRRALGGRALLNRRVGVRTIVSGGFDFERSATRAAPALVCVAFLICEPASIALLQQPLWRNSFFGNAVRDRTDVQFDPTEGYVARASLGWASPVLGSEVSFVRGTAESAAYRQFRQRWVAAASLRVGTFFGPAGLDPANNFIPPGERFFAGGSSTVRGFERNGLGQGVYVTEQLPGAEGEFEPDPAAVRFVPIGGTLLGIANAELRMPSPWLTNMLRFAAFVDAGTVTEGQAWDLVRADWFLTPGVGARFLTPVGPIRLDIGFNPHDPQSGPLYRADGGRLIRVLDSYRPPGRGFFDRFRVHLGIGQAF
jgi:outer membrane protein assembly factor BamA